MRNHWLELHNPGGNALHVFIEIIPALGNSRNPLEDINVFGVLIGEV